MSKKNKLSYIILSLIISFSFINNVFAEELSLTTSVTLDKADVFIGDVASINVVLKSDEAIDSCTFKITNDSTLTLESKNATNNYSFETEDLSALKIKYTADDPADLTNGKTVFKLNYKVNGSGKVSVATTECTTTNDGKTGSYQEVSVSIDAKEKVEDTTLSNIEVTGGTITNFTSNNLTPSIKLEQPNFSLKFTASNEKYQNSIVTTDADGNVLDPSKLTFNDPTGQGIMTLVVTVGDDTNKTTYQLGISYEAPELDNSLASLKVNGVNIGLTKGKTEYKVKISNNATSIKVDATLVDSNNFKFSDGNGPSTYDIKSESIALVIEPKNSQIGGIGVTYIIEIERETANNGGASGSSSNNSSSSQNNISNPQTGNISMFMMAIILIASFVGSIYLYQKNIENYK